MSEDETRDRRPSTDTDTTLFKRQKLDDDLITPELPILSNTLVLDKTQEDTINQLVQSSTIVHGKLFFFHIFFFAATSFALLIPFFLKLEPVQNVDPNCKVFHMNKLTMDM